MSFLPGGLSLGCCPPPRIIFYFTRLKLIQVFSKQRSCVQEGYSRLGATLRHDATFQNNENRKSTILSNDQPDFQSQTGEFIKLVH